MKLREAPAGDDRNSGFSAAEPAGKGAAGARGVAGFFLCPEGFWDVTMEDYKISIQLLSMSQ